MGLFSKLLKKTPKNVTAHIHDQDSGYRTESWAVGSDVSEDVVSRFADGTDLYVVHVNDEAGKKKGVMCKKEIWLSHKAEMDGIDNSLGDFMNKINKGLDSLK